MSKISFPIYKQNTDESETLDRDFDVANITIEKDGSAHSVTIVNNGDGFYYFTATLSGRYSVLLNGSEQDELKDIYFALEDTLTESNVDGTSVEVNGDGNLTVFSGSFVLRQENVVDNLTSSSSIAPGSANQARILNATATEKEDADATILKQADLNSLIVTGGSTVGVSATALKSALNQNYTSEIWINDNKTIPDNIQALETALSKLNAPATVYSYRQIYGDKKLANGVNLDLTGSADTLTYFSESRAGDRFRKIRASFYKRTDDVELIFNCYTNMIMDATTPPTGALEVLYDAGEVISYWTGSLTSGSKAYQITHDITDEDITFTDVFINLTDTTGSEITITRPEILIKSG